jgi:hypothetical protein
MLDKLPAFSCASLVKSLDPTALERMMTHLIMKHFNSYTHILSTEYREKTKDNINEYNHDQKYERAKTTNK